MLLKRLKTELALDLNTFLNLWTKKAFFTLIYLKQHSKVSPVCQERPGRISVFRDNPPGQVIIPYPVTIQCNNTVSGQEGAWLRAEITFRNVDKAGGDTVLSRKLLKKMWLS